MQPRDKAAQGGKQAQGQGGKQERSPIAEAVLGVFAEINKVQSASKAQVFELVKLFKSDPQEFSGAFELAYLKIFKIFHEKANRKMPIKFQQLVASLFGELRPESDGTAGEFFNYFINFLSEGIFSAILGIRITTARMMFHLVKLSLPVLTQTTRGNVLRAVYFLLRLKVSTYKQVGIKLAAQVFSWQHEIRDKIEHELFKIMAVEDNQQIRKMAVTNLPLSRENMGRMLIRLRDKAVEIRSIILRKLTAEKFSLEAMTGSNLLHLLYDGYGNKEASIQEETQRYFLKALQGDRADFGAFVQLFRPGVMLAYPQLYILFNNLTCGILEQLPIEQLCNFTKNLTQELKQLGRGNAATSRLSFPEFIWLKNMGKVERADARTIFQECVPSGTQLARVLLQLLKGRDIWSINQCLQLFSMQKSADEMGRNKMFDSLKKVVTELDYFQTLCDWSGLQHDDICPPLSEQQLYQRKMMLSYFDLPLLSNSYDLLYEAGTAMKALWPDHYEIELKQIIADWNNPEENTLFKEKELAQANIRKVEAQPHGDQRILASLKNKLKEIQEQLLAEGLKTRSVVLVLSRLRAGVSMEDFMPIIKQDLQKQCQEYGLILLALFCLDEAARVEKFLSLYWTHIITSTGERIKIHLLVSLKATTDFMVKFDLSKLTIRHEHPEKTFTHERYIRKLMELALDSDGDIRILAIQALCRLLYHQRVSEELVGAVFMRLLLLWWQTSSEQVGAKAVHTISTFMKLYIERGQGEVRKLSESLCVFFKVMLLEQTAKKSLNKRRIMYNLRYEEFVKRSVVIATTVLKYHKESRQVIWKYQESGAQLGPQQLFLLFLFKHEHLHYCLEKALNIVDFYEDAPLQTVILMKKEVEVMLEEHNFSYRKNLEACLRKLEKDLQQRIQIKNQETFNQELLNGLRKELKEYELLINEAATNLAQELQAAEIFTASLQLFGGIKVESREESEPDEAEMGELIAEIEEVVHVQSESEPSKKGPKGKSHLGRISEGNEEELMRESDEKPVKDKKSRKRLPQPESEEEPSNSAQNKATGPVRVTRSNRARLS